MSGRRADLAVGLAVLLLAAALRLILITEAPPGWRDDELLDVMMNSGIGPDNHPIYFAEQEGHEPLQHYIVAALYRLMGTNLVSHRWLQAMSGLLSVALAVPLGRRLFGREVGLGGAALLAVGFWPLMYARFGLRHALLVPLTMACLYALLLGQERWKGRRAVWYSAAGVALGAALLTYYAARVLPAIVLAYALYQWIVCRRRVDWAGLALMLAVAGVLAGPMFAAIARLPAGEERIQVVGAPLLELLGGKPGLAIETTLTTLGMFTFTGDPEWLYNLPGRPVFDWLTGACLYLGVAAVIWRWRRAESGLALLWLFGGLGPAFISIPAASLGHTIVAQPVAYLLAAHGAAELLGKKRGARFVVPAGLALLVALNAFFTVRDYFGDWNQNRWVRLFYHADVHDAARWLDGATEVTDCAVTSLITQHENDALALNLDLGREVRTRWFDPAGALLVPAGDPVVVFTAAVAPVPWVDALLADSQLVHDARRDEGSVGFAAFRLARPAVNDSQRVPFEGGLTLLAWELSPAGDGVDLQTWWRVEQAGLPFVKQFAHIMVDGERVAGNDRFDAYAPALQPGDLVIQQVHLTTPAGEFTIAFGVYEPDSGVRWPRRDLPADLVELGPFLIDAAGGD